MRALIATVLSFALGLAAISVAHGEPDRKPTLQALEIDNLTHTIGGAVPLPRIEVRDNNGIRCVPVMEWFQYLPWGSSVYVTESGYTLTVPSNDTYGPRSYFFATEKELAMFVSGYRLAREYAETVVSKWGE